MFRKIVSNLSFSPALVGQLGFYAKRLKKEEATRRLGLVFVMLALVVQSLVVFQPPESANASSQNDFVAGGLGLGSNRSIDNFLHPYDQNSNNMKDIMNYVGITREEIVASKFSSWIAADTLSWGLEPRLSAAQGEKKVDIYKDGKVVRTVYTRPLKVLNGANTRIYGWIGHSDKFGWFAIMQACGNLVTTKIPTPPSTPKPPTPKPPTPTPLPANIVQSKSAKNITQGNVNASTVVAQENDRISYTIKVENTGGTASTVELKEQLADVLEYAKIDDFGGGQYKTATKTLEWPSVTLGAGQFQSRTFVVQLLDTIPATPKGASDPTSYDCSMVNVFGNDVTINVNCAPAKVVEEVVSEMPQTGPAENMLFSGIVLAVVTYFYARSRQINKEIRLIRRDLNAGSL